MCAKDDIGGSVPSCEITSLVKKGKINISKKEFAGLPSDEYFPHFVFSKYILPGILKAASNNTIKI